MEHGAVTRSDAGTPQGGVISPLLANVYLHRLDRQWPTRGAGVLVRYADDLVRDVQDRQEADAPLRRSRRSSPSLGLEPKHAKTRIVHLTRRW